MTTPRDTTATTIADLADLLSDFRAHNIVLEEDIATLRKADVDKAEALRVAQASAADWKRVYHVERERAEREHSRADALSRDLAQVRVDLRASEDARTAAAADMERMRDRLAGAMNTGPCDSGWDALVDFGADLNQSDLALRRIAAAQGIAYFDRGWQERVADRALTFNECEIRLVSETEPPPGGPLLALVEVFRCHGSEWKVSDGTAIPSEYVEGWVRQPSKPPAAPAVPEAGPNTERDDVCTLADLRCEQDGGPADVAVAVDDLRDSAGQIQVFHGETLIVERREPHGMVQVRPKSGSCGLVVMATGKVRRTGETWPRAAKPEPRHVHTIGEVLAALPEQGPAQAQPERDPPGTVYQPQTYRRSADGRAWFWNGTDWIRQWGDLSHYPGMRLMALEQEEGMPPATADRQDYRPKAPPNRVPDMRSDRQRAAAALDRAILLADGSDLAYLIRAARRWLADPPNLSEALIHTQKAIVKAVAGSDLGTVLIEAEGHLIRAGAALRTGAA